MDDLRSISFERVLHSLREKGEEYVTSRILYEQLEDAKKIRFGEICNKIIDTGEKATYAEKQAITTPEWQTFIDGLAEARERYYIAKFEYDQAVKVFEAKRSLNALDNRQWQGGSNVT